MRHLYLLTLALFLGFGTNIYGQCAVNEKEIIVDITPDQFPNETSWDIKDLQGNIIASGTTNDDTICVSDTLCLTFTIYDQYGDGIFAPGGYTLTYDGVQIASRSGYDFGDSEYWHMGCPPGFSCQSTAILSEGYTLVPHTEYWYTFIPDSAGNYIFYTCDSNTCDTKLWIYDICEGINVTDEVEGASYYSNDECGTQSFLNTILDQGTIYYVRVGDNAGACGNNPIGLTVQYNGEVSGCMDPTACNYEPIATVPDTCIYAPNPFCPAGPDLTIDQQAINNSIYLDVINNADPCEVVEGCVTGNGVRNVLKFATHIKNIGNQDYYIGNPNAAPHLFDFNNCHGHPHYIGYADYVLFDRNGLEIPVGFKSGFCVMDVTCTNGGTAKFGCSNMGISAGCDDIYGSSTICNWIDVTDVDTGKYTFVVRTNWDQKPDATGRHEVNYKNNFAQVCIELSYDQNGDLAFQLLSDCQIFIDCAGDTLGSAQFDCKGICNGPNLTGDIDSSAAIDNADVNLYINGILNNTLTANQCNDLNADGAMNIVDVALAERCSNNYGVPDRCEFPSGFFDITDTAEFKIVSIDWSNQFFDLAVKNPTNELLGYQIKFSGIQIASAVSLVNATQFPATPSFVTGGNEIIHFSTTDSIISRSFIYQKVVRVFWSSLTGSSICIDNIAGVVEKNYDNITGIGSGCYANDGSQINDLCGDATPLTCGSTVNGSTLNSTNTGAGSPCFIPSNGNGVWYIINGSGEQYTLTLDTANTNFNASIEVYQGDCSSLSCIAGSANGQLAFTSGLGLTYYIYISSTDSSTGNFQFDIFCVDLCPDPGSVALTSIGDTTAILNWTSTNTGATFTIELVAPGQIPNTGNNVAPIINGIVGTDGPPYLISGLTEGTPYDLYYQENCGSGNISSLEGPLSFNTVFGVPANDLCANAQLIFCDQVYIGSTAQATSNDLPSTCGTSVTAPGVWYQMTGIDGSMEVATCGGITNFDTKLHVYTGSCGSLACVAGNDDNCSLQSKVSWASTPGTTYYIYVSGYASNVGDFTLSASCTYNTPPSEPNDNCGDAIALACGDTVSGSTAYATVSDSGTVCGPTITAPGVWYVHTGTGDDVTISTCGTSSFDTRLSVFNGACGALNCIGGNDDFSGCGTGTSQYTFSTVNGVQYYILVHAFQNAIGNFELRLTCDAPCGQSASNGDCSSAHTLNMAESGTCVMHNASNECSGTASTNPSCDLFGNIQDVWFKFNSEASNGASVTIQETTASNLKMSIYDACNGGTVYCSSTAEGTHDVAGLNPSTDYYIQVWNQGGAEEGSFDICVEKFVACSAPTPSTTDVTPNSARLNWTSVTEATGYQVRGKMITAVSIPYVYLSFNASTFTFNATGLVRDNDFMWQVRSFCGSDTSDWSGMDTFSTTCEVPEVLVTNITSNSVRLNWTQSPYALGYLIQGTQIGSNDFITLEVSPGSKTFFNANSLSNATDYIWRIAPVCELPAENLSFSPIDTFTTLTLGSTARTFGSNADILNVYPNPADNVVNIVVKNFNQDLGSITLYDITGTEILSIDEIKFQSNYKIDIRDYPSGVYYISYKSEFEDITKRLIISN